MAAAKFILILINKNTFNTFAAGPPLIQLILYGPLFVRIWTHRQWLKPGMTDSLLPSAVLHKESHIPDR